MSIYIHITRVACRGSVFNGIGCWVSSTHWFQSGRDLFLDISFL